MLLEEEEEDVEHGEVADEAGGEAHEARKAWWSSSWCAAGEAWPSLSCAVAQSCFAVTERGFAEQEDDATEDEELDAVTVAETMACSSPSCCCSKCSRRAVAVEDDEEEGIRRPLRR